VVIDGKRMPYLEGPKVDPADEFEGQKFRDVDELKQILLKDRDRLARALAVRLLTYGTGGSPETLDRRDVDAIVAAARGKGYGLRSLVHEVAQSRPFRHK
jgi:hypothetical protein